MSNYPATKEILNEYPSTVKNKQHRKSARPVLKTLQQANLNVSNRLSGKTHKFGTSRCLMAKVMVMERKSKGLPVYDFGLGEAKGEVAEFIREAGKKAFDAQHTGYVDPAGIPELRKAILKWLNIEEHYSKEEVVVNVGAKAGLFNVFLALSDPGDVILMDTAPWVSYRPMAYCCAATPVNVRPSRGTDNYLKITAQDLEDAIKRHPNARLFLLNNPCNPTAQLYSAEEIEELLQLCVKNRIFFVLDRLYWKTVFDGKNFPEPRIDQQTKPWLIQIDGFSKNWRSVGGLRVGWTIAPPDVAKAMVNIQSHITSGTATTSQYAALEALSHEYDFEMRDDLQQKRDLFQKYARKIPYINIFPSPASFYSFWEISKVFGMKTPNGIVLNNSDDVAEFLLRDYGVATLSGSAFLHDGFLRLCFHIPKEEIEKGLQATRMAFESLEPAL
ncbi:MAG: aminotransferase class I/II-fold pyridoxal phosphate-dependent enzyme [Candidatus Dadabacteria bacterium]|nr:MAG: aminotransferase class I/II-fold pyridoxal phosphate-dependent enzyme [Candidatus Dadabacteria bacterium]